MKESFKLAVQFLKSCSHIQHMGELSAPIATHGNAAPARSDTANKQV